MRLVTAEEMRTLDRLTIEGGTPGNVLMERAGQGATAAFLQCVPRLRRRGARVLIVAGKGNNGGDGFVIARLLKKRGARVQVALLGRAAEVGGDALRNLRAYRRLRGVLVEITDDAGLARLSAMAGEVDAVVDAIFGTGLRDAVRGLPASAIEIVNTCGAPVLAVDIPSGLDADRGRPLGVAVQAEVTATFGFAKAGQVQHPGVRHCGALAVVDIGLAAAALAAVPARAALLEAADAARLAPRRDPEVHKGDCGHVLIIAGSFGHTGAAQLAARGAGRVGAGLVTLVGPRSLYPVYAAGVLEAMTETLPDDDGRIRFDAARLAALVGGKSAVVIGPGIGTHHGAAATVRWLLEETGLPIVLDADALTILGRDPAPLRAAGGRAVLTPHPGEMSRLNGGDTASVQADRIGQARRFATAHGCTLVLKGARTVIAEPGGFAWINPTGNPGMASGGMGDVLAGAIGGLLAQRLPPAEAACLGVYLHGLAADRAAADGEVGLLAGDVVEGLRPAMAALLAG
ncbi:NAD(P)H-hydrate dehydratase [bacterium]|nr:NAD(P)H-hydrate dehydratase [bacterium]